MEVTAKPADVTFCVENVDFHCHKILFMERSKFFRKHLSEANASFCTQTVELPYITIAHFEIILKHLYNEEIILDKLTIQDLMDVVEHAHGFEINDLKRLLLQHLVGILNYENVLSVYCWTEMFDVIPVETKCLSVIYNNSEKILTENLYLTLPKTLMIKIFSSDYFCEDELLIFQSICLWVEENNESEVDDLLSCVRLSLISDSGLLEIVAPSNRFRVEHLQKTIAFRKETNNENCLFRGKIIPSANVATESSGAKVIEGVTPSDMLKGNYTIYDEQQLLSTRPDIIVKTKGSTQNTVIKLGHPFFINFIQLKFTGLPDTPYSFLVAVSADNRNWSRVAEDSNIGTFPMEFYTFPTRVVRYIRVVSCISTTSSSFLALTTFACKYSCQEFDMGKPFKSNSSRLYIH